jgi:hypothetical protein
MPVGFPSTPLGKVPTVHATKVKLPRQLHLGHLESSQPADRLGRIA